MSSSSRGSVKFSPLDLLFPKSKARTPAGINGLPAKAGASGQTKASASELAHTTRHNTRAQPAITKTPEPPKLNKPEGHSINSEQARRKRNIAFYCCLILLLAVVGALLYDLLR